MTVPAPRTVVSIRIKRSYLSVANKAAVLQNMTLGEWLEMIIHANVPPRLRKELR